MGDPKTWLQNSRRLIFNDDGHGLNESSVEDLRTYLANYDGRCFEQLYDREKPFSFTPTDLLAVTALSVTVPPPVAAWILSGEGATATSSCLSNILPDSRIEDLSRRDYERLLGEASEAWKLWKLLYGQPGIGSTIAGKLIAAKRPHLVPISDGYVKDTLECTERDLWMCMWTVLTDDEIRTGVANMHDEVPAARDLSLLRVLDIVAWRHGRRVITGDS